MNQQNEPVAELTLRVVILGIVLAMILSAANAYLGLFAGMTVSASIPAAVVSMGLFRMLRKASILENNLVQTAASAGESVAAGAIFTLPALLILGFWTEMNFLYVTLLCGLGGLLGVLFTIPLRRSLIIQEKLQFPEGVATAEVLEAGQKGGRGLAVLVKTAIAGAIYKTANLGVGLWPEAMEGATRLSGWVLYGGIGLSPALISVGFIVGLNIAVLIFVGGAMNWLVAIPLYALLTDSSAGPDVVESAYAIWKSHTRYIGVGAMVIGGFWTIFQMRRNLLSGVFSGLRAYTQASPGRQQVDRTEKDIPMTWVLGLTLVSVVPLFVLYEVFIKSTPVSLTMAVCMVGAAFIFSAVAGYMAGLVGSSNNPISGVTIATVLFCSLLLLGLMGKGSLSGPAAAIIVGSVVCSAAAIAGDNMQDLKTGHIIGSTPWRQQTLQIIGTLAGAVIVGPVMALLNHAYGFAGAVGAGEKALSAPQANLMASIAKGVFAGNLPWTMIFIGMVVAAGIIACDLWLKARNSTFRLPILAVAIGIYLPFQLSVAIFLGGLLHFAAGRVRRNRTPKTEFEKEGGMGLLAASGLITGEALIGILLAIPYVLPGVKEKMPLIKNAGLIGPMAGIVCLLGICWLLYRAAIKPSES
jgi:putative OPT family oligopeptide transporter